MNLRVVETRLRTHQLRTRFPFRYGIATMTQVPHVILGVDVDIDGKVQRGMSAENLVPKWFTKDPETSPQQDIDWMLAVIGSACATARGLSGSRSVFEFWASLNRAMQCDDPPLLTGLGVSLVERAVIDAFCRAQGVTFARALSKNLFEIDLGKLYPELRGVQPANFLPKTPLDRIVVRHTVGLSDPLTDADIAETERVDDGLPQSLEACIKAYGLTHFKIKLSGDVQRDIDRLRQIAPLMDHDNAVTLDGNENFHDILTFKDFWRRLIEDGTLLQHLLFVEQPLHRDIALGDEARRELSSWRDRPAMIIDESGGTIESLPEALQCGYVGTSHKNCKGVFKGIAAKCLIAHRKQSNLILSAEDLSNTGPIALLQDLAVVAALGIAHAERNGHHYFRGLSAWPDEVQAGLLASHGDIYHRLPNGCVSVYIRHGRIDVASANHCPFGPLTLLE